MSIAITSEPKRHYLLIKTQGKLVSTEDLISQSSLILAEIAKYNYKKILVNHLGTDLPINLVPYFDLVKSYAKSFKPEVRQAKILVVVKKQYKEFGASWETICQSKGLNCHVFISLKKAENYLFDGEDEDEN